MAICASPASILATSHAGELGRWLGHVRSSERLYGLGTYRLSPDAYRIWSASNLEKALGSLDKRARWETPDGVV